MCGLIGIASVDPQVNRSWLSVGRDAILHRGPDDLGEWWSDDGRVGFAHRRLSVVDLSPLGHQPLHLPDQGLSIVFNGEIYNHNKLRDELKDLGYSFNSRSDTEVLLAAYAAWGEDCINRLNGMFAFAILDSHHHKLFIARDRAGEKPLFYRLANNCLQFASELKSLLANSANPRRIDSQALDCYLAMGYVPGERCILHGYNKLPPAHCMSFDLLSGNLRVRRYWQLPDPLADEWSFSEASLLSELENLLEDAVGAQMVADVPVGVLLSGGVDSSLVTSMAVRHCRKVLTFSIGFDGYTGVDETPYARFIANHFGTEHHELHAKPATADLIPKLALQFDEPMADSSMIPTFLVSRLVRQHCTVALGGDGADELFAGYPMYQRLMWLQKYTKAIPVFLRRKIASTATRLLPVGKKGRNYFASLGYDYASQTPHFQELFDVRYRRRLIPGFAVSFGLAETIRQSRSSITGDLLQRATRFDFENYLAEDILVKVDRASMLNSLEVRSPFLDYRLVEFAFSRIPTSFKATTRNKKILLRHLAKKVLPSGFDNTRKQGFSIPMAAWLKSGPFRQLFWDTLLADDALFDRKVVENLLRGQDHGHYNGERLFALVQLELWRKAYQAYL